MKTLKSLLSIVAFVLTVASGVQGQWQDSLEHIYNTNNGNVGIGIKTPTSKLHVVGDVKIEENLNVLNAITGKSLLISDNDGNGVTDGGIISLSENMIFVNFLERMVFWNINGKAMSLGENGLFLGSSFVNVGNIPEDYLFVTDGKILCEGIKVQLSEEWADFVFNKGYKLMSLADLDRFIKENKHLPGIPPAHEIEENGLNLGVMQTKMMEKIEELTLYIIELNKKNESLQKHVEELEKSMHH